MIKLKILRLSDYPGLPRHCRYKRYKNHNNPCKRDAGGVSGRGKGDVLREIEIRVIGCEGGGSSNKQRHVGGKRQGAHSVFSYLQDEAAMFAP